MDWGTDTPFFHAEYSIINSKALTHAQLVRPLPDTSRKCRNGELIVKAILICLKLNGIIEELTKPC